MLTTVYLIRHAEAEGNVYRRCHGQYDSMLTPRAWEQLPYLAKRFEPVALDAIYSSDLYRARMTAGAIAGAKGMEVRVRPVLREINMGEWEDCPWAELPLREPEKYHAWQTEPWKCVVPGGESVTDAGERMFGGIRQLVCEHAGQTIAVVTHGSAIRGALCIAQGLAPEQLGEIGWGDNTCVAKLEFDDAGNVRVVYMNDASHLPAALSTFASIGWTNSKGVPVSPQIWFKSVDLDNADERAALLSFARQKYESAYGSAAALDETTYVEDTRAMLARCARAVTFGMLDGVPVALVRLNVCDDSHPDTGMVGSLVIDSEWRGCGLSQQLIGQAISVYRELGKDYLCALVAEHNERAKAFYHKFAFTQEGEVTNALGRHLRMVKPIKVEPYCTDA